jgi:hypothetical protein
MHESLTVDDADHGRPAPARRHRRRAYFQIRPLPLIGVLLLGWLLWAATTPGGIDARLHGISETLQGLLDDATTDPGLKRAARYYNDQYAQLGSYPMLSDEQIRDDPNAGWGIGVDVEWCSRDAIVISSLTGRGTISRLLLDGEDLGDVPGKQACPTDYSAPLPWEFHDNP